MTPEEVHAVAKGAAQGQALWYVLSGCIGGAVTGIGAYLVQKGKNRATREDFQEVLRQQRSTTSAVEEIKDVLGAKAWLRQRHWDAKERHLANLLRELAALELMLHYLLYTAYSLKDVPVDDPRREPEKLKRFNDTREDSIARIRVIAEAIGAAEMYLPAEVVDPVRTLLLNEFQSSPDDDDLESGLARAKEWIDEIGVVRASVLAVGRIEVGIVKPSSPD